MSSNKNCSRSIQLGRFSLFQSSASRSQFWLPELAFFFGFFLGCYGDVACEAYLYVFLFRRASDEAYLYVYLLKVACDTNLYVFLLRRAPRTCPDLDFQEKWISLDSIGLFHLTPELSLQILILASKFGFFWAFSWVAMGTLLVRRIYTYFCLGEVQMKIIYTYICLRRLLVRAIYTYFCLGELPELAQTLISKKNGSRSIQLGSFSLLQNSASRSQFWFLSLPSKKDHSNYQISTFGAYFRFRQDIWLLGVDNK